MTPVSLAYFILGLSALFWPLATLFFKRRVLGGQWLIMTALLLIGLSIIIYSTFFNTFLAGEYILVIFYMLLSLTVPPMTQMSVTALTRTQGVSRMARLLILPALSLALLMALSVAIGGADMYRLWILRGTDAIAWMFMPNSWRYNLIVAVHFYLYWIVLVVEVAFVAVYTIVSIRHFQRQVGEYHAADAINRRRSMLFYSSIAVNCIAIIISYIIFPFNRPRPLLPVIIFCVVEGAAMLLMGGLSFRIRYSAESLNLDIARTSSSSTRHNLDTLGHRLTAFIEKGNFRDPDISVFSLATQFHVSQDQVVDALYHIHGAHFSDYIDSLRVDHASSLLATASQDDPLLLDRVAHQCGYRDAAALKTAWQRVLHTPLDQSALLD
jgi:AraC-like DNA-binding protein